jgi:hypothetical protein
LRRTNGWSRWRAACPARRRCRAWAAGRFPNDVDLHAFRNGNSLNDAIGDVANGTADEVSCIASMQHDVVGTSDTNIAPLRIIAQAP